MPTSALEPVAKHWSSRRFALLSILLPIGAFVLMVAAFAAMPSGRRVTWSDAQTAIVLASVAAVPLASTAGIVLSIMAVVRARHERLLGLAVGSTLAVIGVIVSVASVALLAFLAWAALQGLASFR
jgi:hypothetical protein